MLEQFLLRESEVLKLDAQLIGFLPCRMDDNRIGADDDRRIGQGEGEAENRAGVKRPFDFEHHAGFADVANRADLPYFRLALVRAPVFIYLDADEIDDDPG